MMEKRQYFWELHQLLFCCEMFHGWVDNRYYSAEVADLTE
jgi:hypothetical protein